MSLAPLEYLEYFTNLDFPLHRNESPSLSETQGTDHLWIML